MQAIHPLADAMSDNFDVIRQFLMIRTERERRFVRMKTFTPANRVEFHHRQDGRSGL